jgi:hypothetical protein
MGMGAEDDDLQGSLAEPSFTFFPIDPAAPGTEVTVLEERVGLFNPLGQLPLFFQFLISWSPLFFFVGHGGRRGRGEEQRASEKERLLDEIPAGEFHGDILLKDHDSFNFLPE